MLQCTNKKAKPDIEIKPINLALQGGGAHGAFTWGVLDRLLEAECFDIEGVSGTSAGAMNAAVMAYGYLLDGREGAREKLAEFWNELTRKSFSDIHNVGLDKLPGVDLSPAFSIIRSLGWFLSPYQFNPLAFDPLRDIVEKVIDFEHLQKENSIKLFIAATQVRTGKIRIFENHELTSDALLASACLPMMHHAIEIEGEAYWDGGFSGNPAVYPLLHNCKSNDIVVVLLSPLEIETHPMNVEDIRNRVSDLSFNAAFLREMRAIADAQVRYGKGVVTLGKLERKLRDTKIHLIEAENLMKDLSHDSKLDTSRAFLNMLFEEGRAHADKWLGESFSGIGSHSTINVTKLFV
ncbi:MAG: patatin-like phospholipase family protein [Gammaproteobacteria bacterium]